MKKKYSYYITTLFLLFFCVSCENEEGVVGSSIIVNDNHNIVSYPTDEITTTSIANTDMLAIAGETSFLGNYTDPVFGQVDASFSFQLQPLTLNDNEPNSANINKILLKIPYVSFYSASDPGNVEFEFTIGLLDSNTSNLNELYIHENITIANNPFNPVSLSLDEIQDTDNIELELTKSQEIQDYLLNLLDNNDVSLNSGLNLMATANSKESGGIMTVNTSSAFLSIIYNESADTAQFPIGTDEVLKLNHFQSSLDTQADTSKVYLQSIGGVYSEIDMQFLTDLKEEGYIAVNNAELILNISGENGNFPLPENLRLYQFLDNEAIDFSNAEPIAESDNVNTENQTYIFNLTGITHEIINGEREPIFQLYLNSPTSEINRLVLDNTFELNLLLIKEDN